MQNPTTPNIQELSGLDDLELLKKGDVVPIMYRHVPSSDGESEHLGAYHGRSSLTQQLIFLIPAKMSEEYIVMYWARKQDVQIDNGKIILTEDKCTAQSFNEDNHYYRDLNSILVTSRLR